MPRYPLYYWRTFSLNIQFWVGSFYSPQFLKILCPSFCPTILSSNKKLTIIRNDTPLWVGCCFTSVYFQVLFFIFNFQKFNFDLSCHGLPFLEFALLLKYMLCPLPSSASIHYFMELVLSSFSFLLRFYIFCYSPICPSGSLKNFFQCIFSLLFRLGHFYCSFFQFIDSFLCSHSFYCFWISIWFSFISSISLLRLSIMKHSN